MLQFRVPVRGVSVRATAAAVLALAAALPTVASAQGRPDLVAQSLRDSTKRFVPGEVIVQFRPEASEQQKAAILGRLEGRVVRDLRLRDQRRDGRGDLHVARVGSGLAMQTLLNRLQAEALVDFAEPNWIVTRDATSDDPIFTSGGLWGMYGADTTPANQWGSGAANAWAEGKTCSSSVMVAVIDEGAMHTHRDLAGQFWTNPFDPENGVDDDGNGYVDDIRGWDFVGDDNTTFDGRGDDHGTHVAGTIGAKGGNAQGVAGMCWNITMISAKFLGTSGGTTADAILAVDYVTDLKTRHGLNLVASNNSWGGGGFSTGLKDAITRAGAADILFVASAGNSGANADVSPSYPAAYDNANIISVAMITSSGNLNGSSNYGLVSVDLGAPGTSVQSTVPGRRGRSAYASYTGTSMAAPHVTGAVAMYKSLNPGATAPQIKAAILAATIPTPSLAGKTVTGGRLDVSGF